MFFSGLHENQPSLGTNVSITDGYDIQLRMPMWELVVSALSLIIVILFTFVGNALVIVSVLTYRPLSIVQNYFIVSLAVADLTMAVFVLPLGAAYAIIGRWIFGDVLCRVWLTADILCCTASILNLCAIALDRYWAIKDAINYAQKRTAVRVLVMIGLVWAISVVICLPPILGWNDWKHDFTSDVPCTPTKNKGYVIYSAVGSFYCPLFIMIILNVKIFRSIRRRLRQRMSRKSQALDLQNVRFSRLEDLSRSPFNEHFRISKEQTIPKESRGLTSEESEKQVSIFAKDPMRRESTVAKEPICRASIVADEITREIIVAKDFTRRESLLVRQAKKRASTVSKELKRRESIKDDNEIYQVIRRTRKISLTKERRAARTLGTVMGAFVVCWLPFFLLYVIIPFCPTCTPPSEKVHNFIIWLGYLNSAFNPVIYTFLNKDFSKAIGSVLRRQVKRVNDSFQSHKI